MKRILIVTGVVVLLAAGFLLYFFAVRRAPAATTASPAPSPLSRATGLARVSPSSSTTAKDTAMRLSQTQAFSSLHSQPDGSVVYYTKEGAWKVLPSSGATPEAFSEVRIDDLAEVAWSPDGKQVITARQSDTGRSLVFYDYATAKAQPIIPTARGIVWSPGGNAIAYQEKNDQAGVNQIVRSSPRGEDPRIIFKTRVALWRLYWPVAERMFVAAQPSGLAAGTLFALNPQDGALQKLFALNGLIVNPSPDGTRVLYSYTDSKGSNSSLSVSAVGTAQTRSLTAELGVKTLAEKCAWSRDAKTIVCAVFNENPDRSVMPDDYYKGIFTSSETLVRINLETNERTEITLPRGIDVSAPTLTSTGEWFVFINRADGMVYGVELNQVQSLEDIKH